MSSRPRKFKKILLLICDQWRSRRHWPDEQALPLPTYRRLCRHGIEFTNASIASCACTPSRATIFSGKYGRETGTYLTSGFHIPIGGDDGTYVPSAPTDRRCWLPPANILKNIGTYFKEAGFDTQYRGKWHLSPVEGQWPEQPAGDLEDYSFCGWTPPEGHGQNHVNWGFGADVSYVQDAVQQLWDFSRKPREPWFLVCSLINPHDIGLYGLWPLNIPDSGIKLPRSFTDRLHDKPQCQRDNRAIWNRLTFAPRAVNQLRLRRHRPNRHELWHEFIQYYAHLTQMADFHMGIVLDALESSGQAEETLVIFLSDHGELGGAHGMTQKWYQAYEETINVPLVFSNPKWFPRGRRNSSMVSLIDVAPTLLRMAGLALPKKRDTLRGVDLSPILKGEQSKVQDAVLFVSDDDLWGAYELSERFGPVAQPNWIRTIRTPRWKLSRYVDRYDHHANEYELYDLKNDPDEITNLANDDSHRALVKRLDRRLQLLLDEKYYQEEYAFNPPDA